MSEASSEMKTIRVLTFSGKEEHWDEWRNTFEVIAGQRGYDEIMRGGVTAPDFDINLEEKKTHSTSLYDDDTKAKMAAARKGNKDGSRDLTLAVQGTAFNLVREAKTEELPYGDLKLAWSKLVDEWDPQTGQEMVSLVTKFQQTKLEDPKMNVTDWLTDLSWQ